jgi:acyl carrier protein
MSEQDRRLLRCFASVFPNLTEKEIKASSAGALFEVDSLAGVTLLTLIGDEFGVNIELPDLLALGSFDRICQFLRERNPNISEQRQEAR